MKESLNRPPTVLDSINEEHQVDKTLGDSWANLVNNNHSNVPPPPQNATTYKRAYQNYNPRSYSSFDSTSNDKKNSLPENDQEEEENEEQVETIQLDEDHQRPRSASLIKIKKQSKLPQTPIGRSSSSLQQKHRVESLQFNDDDNENEDQQRKEIILPPIKIKEPSVQDDNTKSRKIRDLQNKLSRQEEESKKKLNELQSKQSRLENALKLLVKQTSSFGKRRPQTPDNIESKFNLRVH
jgi:hypothetical protein